MLEIQLKNVLSIEEFNFPEVRPRRSARKRVKHEEVESSLLKISTPSEESQRDFYHAMKLFFSIDLPKKLSNYVKKGCDNGEIRMKVKASENQQYLLIMKVYLTDIYEKQVIKYDENGNEVASEESFDKVSQSLTPLFKEFILDDINLDKFTCGVSRKKAFDLLASSFTEEKDSVLQKNKEEIIEIDNLLADKLREKMSIEPKMEKYKEKKDKIDQNVKLNASEVEGSDEVEISWAKSGDEKNCETIMS